jgi:type IV pilus assembly protein PilY1
VDYSFTGGKKGWFNDLDSVAAGGTEGLDSPEFPGERAIRNIQYRGYKAFVNSVIPRSSSSCVDVAGGYALAFCPGTGGENCLGGGVFDLNDDGDFGILDEVDDLVVAGIRFDDSVPTDSSFIGDTRVTQLSNQELQAVTTNTNLGSNLGRLSWKRLDSID